MYQEVRSPLHGTTVILNLAAYGLNTVKGDIMNAYHEMAAQEERYFRCVDYIRFSHIVNTVDYHKQVALKVIDFRWMVLLAYRILYSEMMKVECPLQEMVILFRWSIDVNPEKTFTRVKCALHLICGKVSLNLASTS
jgi:hypothetical protein